jgi:hypothetical protein
MREQAGQAAEAIGAARGEAEARARDAASQLAAALTAHAEDLDRVRADAGARIQAAQDQRDAAIA